MSGKSHGRRSLLGYSPWGRKELDTTERLHFLSLWVGHCGHGAAREKLCLVGWPGGNQTSQGQTLPSAGCVPRRAGWALLGPSGFSVWLSPSRPGAPWGGSLPVPPHSVQHSQGLAQGSGHCGESPDSWLFKMHALQKMGGVLLTPRKAGMEGKGVAEAWVGRSEGVLPRRDGTRRVQSDQLRPWACHCLPSHPRGQRLKEAPGPRHTGK